MIGLVRVHAGPVRLGPLAPRTFSVFFLLVALFAFWDCRRAWKM
jgi:hypothetical protein